MTYSTPYKTLLNLYHSENINTQLNKVASILDDVELCLTRFANDVTIYTRRENRSYLQYMIGKVEDELTCQAIELKSNSFSKVSEILGVEFTEIMQTTRSKKLFKSGERLKCILEKYDTTYLELKVQISQLEI